MKNLPKLSFPLQDSQLISQPNQNLPSSIHSSESRKIATASQGRNLSPFTWNNIKLPAVFIKEKNQKSNKNKQKEEEKQLVNKKPMGKNEILQPKKLETIGQKAKKALNISMQLKKMLPKRASPLKNLHQKVFVQYQKRKLTTGLKIREDRSFTQKQAREMLAKTYETMQVRAQNNIDKADVRLGDKNLMRTEQRFRNSSSHYEKEDAGKVGLRNERYGKDVNTEKRKEINAEIRKEINAEKKDASSFRARQNKQLKHYANAKQQISPLKNSIIVKSSLNSPSKNKHSPSKNVHSHSINQQMQPYIRHYVTSLSHSKDPNKLKLFVTTNPKYHPLHPTHNSTPNYPLKTLIWTKLQSLNIFRQKSPQQYYNHVEGSHVLTSKQKLHHILNGGKGQHKTFYPVSFSLPKDYNQFVQEYDWVLVKGCLKLLIKEIRLFEKGLMHEVDINFIQQRDIKLNKQKGIDPNKQKDELKKQKATSFIKQKGSDLIKQNYFNKQKDTNLNQQNHSYFDEQKRNNGEFTVCLSDILDDLTRQTKNQSQLKLLKLCLFLQSGRKKQKLCTLFQLIKSYRSVDITLSQSLYIDIIDWCLQLARHSQLSTQQQNYQTRKMMANTLNLSNVDYRLIQLLKAYDYLFSTELPSYLYRSLTGFTNSWLIKPFAASKAAGISLVINSQQFYTTSDYEYKQYRHRAKYHNKIFMKYLDNPFLINHSGIDYFVPKKLKSLQKHLNPHDYDKKLIQINHKLERFLRLQDKFFGRKFDIRQWVMIVCDEQAQDLADKKNEKIMSTTGYDYRKSPRGFKSTKRTKIYKYHTGYCRFAQKPYSLKTSDGQVHLTNYEMYKKSDRKSQSPTKGQRSLNGSILEKSDNCNSEREYKLERNQGQLKKKQGQAQRKQGQAQRRQGQLQRKQGQDKFTRRRVGSISKEQKESVLMLDELFDYVDFVAQIKDSKPSIIINPNTTPSPHQHSSISQTYHNQLDAILQSLFQACLPHLTHQNKTFQLFGVDLLMDQDSNFYLLEVNLNPGCSATRDQQLYRQAQIMVESMFDTIMRDQDPQQLEQLKYKRIDKLQHNLIGSREFIADNQFYIDAEASVKNFQDKPIQDQHLFGQQVSNKQQKSNKYKKWVLVAQNQDTH